MKRLMLYAIVLLTLVDAIVLGVALGYSWANRGLNNSERAELALDRQVLSGGPLGYGKHH